ncbi:ankyrin, partial [Byssothecium circinans]
RRAVHVACASLWDDAIKVLIRAGAKIDVKDTMGRMPIHFAASATYRDCFQYLMDTFKNIDINEADYDKWTPLMWAARSGSVLTVKGLLERNADMWARGSGSNTKEEWGRH